MDILKKLWPNAFNVDTGKALAITIIVYIVANFVVGLVLGLLAAIPLLGFVFGIIRWLVGIYCFVGILLAILAFLKVFK